MYSLEHGRIDEDALGGSGASVDESFSSGIPKTQLWEQCRGSALCRLQRGSQFGGARFCWELTRWALVGEVVFGGAYKAEVVLLSTLLFFRQ